MCVLYWRGDICNLKRIMRGYHDYGCGRATIWKEL